MPKSPVTADILEPGDVLLNLPAEWAFHRVLPVQDACQSTDVVVAELFRPALRVDLGLIAQAQSDGWPHAVDIAQGDVGRLVGRNVNTQDTRHGLPSCFNLAAVYVADYCK